MRLGKAGRLRWSPTLTELFISPAQGKASFLGLARKYLMRRSGKVTGANDVNICVRAPRMAVFIKLRPALYLMQSRSTLLEFFSSPGTHATTLATTERAQGF